MDVVTLDNIRRAPNFADALRQLFYGLMLTTGGEGEVEIDGVPTVACKGLMACARPGDVGTVISDRGLTALELIFERDFLLSFFSDPHFLDGIAYFSPHRTSPYLMLDDALYNRIIGLYDSLLLELHGTEKGQLALATRNALRGADAVAEGHSCGDCHHLRERPR